MISAAGSYKPTKAATTLRTKWLNCLAYLTPRFATYFVVNVKPVLQMPYHTLVVGLLLSTAMIVAAYANSPVTTMTLLLLNCAGL
jgi:hypothetical protein